MLKSGREKAILKQAVIVIGIMGAIYFLVLSPFLREGSSILDEELERKTTEIKKYISRMGSMPSKDSFNRMQKEKLAMEEKLQSLIDFIDPEKVRISEASTEAGLYFIERLHSLMKEALDTADKKGIELPENLGFGDGLPKNNMVDMLLRQLEVVEMTVNILLESEKIEISAIKTLKSIDYIEPLSKEIFYTEIPVQISIKTDTQALINLLLELKNKSPVVSVKEMHIKSSELDSGDIEASLVLSTFQVARPVTKF